MAVAVVVAGWRVWPAAAQVQPSATRSLIPNVGGPGGDGDGDHYRSNYGRLGESQRRCPTGSATYLGEPDRDDARSSEDGQAGHTHLTGNRLRHLHRYRLGHGGKPMTFSGTAEGLDRLRPRRRRRWQASVTVTVGCGHRSQRHRSLTQASVAAGGR